MIEFQHSYLNPMEQMARERFYKRLVWIVDGTRLKGDLPRFLKGKKTIVTTPVRGVLASRFPDECFPSAWTQSSALVLFDFDGVPAEGEDEHPDAKLWCLMPGRADGRALLGSHPRREFVRLARERRHILPSREILTVLSDYYRRCREFEARQARVHYATAFRPRRYLRRTRWRR